MNAGWPRFAPRFWALTWATLTAPLLPKYPSMISTKGCKDYQFQPSGLRLRSVRTSGDAGHGQRMAAQRIVCGMACRYLCEQRHLFRPPRLAGDGAGAQQRLWSFG